MRGRGFQSHDRRDIDGVNGPQTGARMAWIEYLRTRADHGPALAARGCRHDAAAAAVSPGSVRTG